MKPRALIRLTKAECQGFSSDISIKFALPPSPPPPSHSPPLTILLFCCFCHCDGIKKSVILHPPVANMSVVKAEGSKQSKAAIASDPWSSPAALSDDGYSPSTAVWCSTELWPQPLSWLKSLENGSFTTVALSFQTLRPQLSRMTVHSPSLSAPFRTYPR